MKQGSRPSYSALSCQTAGQRLVGVDDIDEIPEVNAEEAKGLKDLLYSADVDNFLKQAEEAANGGRID